MTYFLNIFFNLETLWWVCNLLLYSCLQLWRALSTLLGRYNRIARVASAQRHRGKFLFSQTHTAWPLEFSHRTREENEFTVSAQARTIKKQQLSKTVFFPGAVWRKKANVFFGCVQASRMMSECGGWWVRGERVWGGVDAIWGKTRVWVVGGEGEIKAETTRPARGFGWCKSDFRLTCSECAVPYGPLLLATGRR